MSQYNDTYFFNSNRAEKISNKRNELVNGVSKIQICYNSEKQNNKNLIKVPIENIKEFFKNNLYRYPTYIDFIDSEYENNEEVQEQIIKIFATIFEEIDNDDIKTVEELILKFKNLKIKVDKENIKIAFIVTKKQNDLFKYLKKISNRMDGRFKNKFLTEKSKSNMILDEIKTKDVLKFLLEYKPNAIVLYNEFYPQLFNNSIVHIYIVSSFAVCNKIIEYEDKIDMKKNIFFTSSSYYENVLMQKGISSLKLSPIVENIPNSLKSFESRKIDLLITENYFDLNEYIVFQKMIKKVKKYLKNKNKLSIKKTISFIETTSYPNNDDWELNLFIHKHIVLQFILKNINLDKNITIVGKNWDKFEIENYNIQDKYTKKRYKNCKYVFLVSSTIVSDDLLNILKYGAIPIIYDLRSEDKYYDSIFDEYCLFVKNYVEIDNIIDKKIRPNKKFDKFIEDKFNIKNTTRSLTSSLL